MTFTLKEVLLNGVMASFDEVRLQRCCKPNRYLRSPNREARDRLLTHCDASRGTHLSVTLECIGCWSWVSLLQADEHCRIRCRRRRST